METALEFDAQDLNGPFCIIKIRSMLKKMYPGQMLHVIATDIESLDDIYSYCNHTGDKLLLGQIENKKYYYTIKKKSQ